MSTNLVDSLYGHEKRLITAEEHQLCNNFKRWRAAANPISPNPKVLTNDGGANDDVSQADVVRDAALYREAERVLMGLGREVKDAFVNVVVMDKMPKLTMRDSVNASLYVRNNEAWFYKGLVALVKWYRSSKPKKAA